MKSQPIRVWDKQLKRMTYLPHLVPLVTSAGVCFGVFATVPPADAPANPIAGALIKASDYVIMHCTGRKDMTGVSLFDGDIVDGAVTFDMGPDMPEMALEKRGIVGWNEEFAGWAILIPEGSIDHCQPYECDFASSTKIGNIFETPELLKLAQTP